MAAIEANTSSSAEVAILPTYLALLGGISSGRSNTEHGFTPSSLAKVRWQQQTAPIMITFNFVNPFFQSVQAQIQKLEREAKEAEEQGRPFHEPTQEDIKPILKTAIVAATKAWANVLGRVCLQTAIASALMQKNTPFSNSMVLQWDTYPRMHQKYVGDFLQSFYIPRSLAGLLGPATGDADIALWDTETSPLAAAQDSFKRHAIISVSNVIATSVVHAAMHGVGPDREGLRSQWKTARWRPLSEIVSATCQVEAFSLIGSMCGAASARMMKCNGKGEYWGEIIGAFCMSGISTLLQLTQAASRMKKEKNQQGGRQLGSQ